MRVTVAGPNILKPNSSKQKATYTIMSSQAVDLTDLTLDGSVATDKTKRNVAFKHLTKNPSPA